MRVSELFEATTQSWKVKQFEGGGRWYIYDTQRKGLENPIADFDTKKQAQAEAEKRNGELTEKKWIHTDPAKRGMFDGKSLAQLEAELAKLKKSGPHKKGSAELTKMQELMFAIRAKKTHGKFNEEALSEDYSQDRKDAKAIEGIMRTIDSKLPRVCRHKGWDVYPEGKIVEWITQESEPEESQDAANKIAEVLAKAGYKGWKVRVCLRDLVRDDDEKTPWKKATS